RSAWPAPALNPEIPKPYSNSWTATTPSTSHRSSPRIARTPSSTNSPPNPASPGQFGTHAPSSKPAPRAASPPCRPRADTDNETSASRPWTPTIQAPAHSPQSRAETLPPRSAPDPCANKYDSPPAPPPPTTSALPRHPDSPPASSH